MKKALIILIALLLSGEGWGANIYYYVCPAGTPGNSPASPYDTWAKAANTLRTATEAVNADAGGDGTPILYVAPGEYTPSSYHGFYLADADWSGGQIIFTEAYGSTTPNTVYGATIINTSGSRSGIYIGHQTDNLTISGRAIFRSGALTTTPACCNINGSGGSTDNITFNDIEFEQTAASTSHNLFIAYCSGIKFNRCRVRTYWNPSVTVVSVRTGTGAADVTFNDCIFTGSIYGATNAEIAVLAGIVTLNNCLIMDCGQYSVEAIGGTTYINNSIIGGPTINTAAYPLRTGAGELHVSNSLIVPGGVNPDAYVGAGSLNTDSNNIYGSCPRWVSAGDKPGYIVFRIDDQASLSHVLDLEPLLAQYGYKGTFYGELSDLETSGTQAQDIIDMQGLIQRGTIEVGLHGYSHSDLSSKNGLAFSQSGGSNCAVTYDGSTITCECDGADYDQTYAVQAGDHFSTIRAALNGKKGWTVAYSTAMDARAKASSLATMTSTAEPCEIPLNLTAYNAGYFNDEIYAPIAQLKSYLNPTDAIVDGQLGANWNLKTIGNPFNTGSTASRAAVIASGYQAGSWNDSITKSRITDIDLYSVHAINPPGVATSTESEIRAGANAIALLALHSGYAVEMVVHSPDYFATELSVAQWGYVLDEWAKYPNLVVTSTQLLAQTIRAGWTDDGDGTFSRTYTSYGADYHLTGASPCINSGSNAVWSGTASVTSYNGIGITNAAGTIIAPGGTVDIGAYEYKPSINNAARFLLLFD